MSAVFPGADAVSVVAQHQYYSVTEGGLVPADCDAPFSDLLDGALMVLDVRPLRRCGRPLRQAFSRY
jgi:hypothetical protein